MATIVTSTTTKQHLDQIIIAINNNHLLKTNKDRQRKCNTCRKFRQQTYL